jgi:hypothetical protein
MFFFACLTEPIRIGPKMNIDIKSGNAGPDMRNASEVNQVSYELNSFEWNLWQTVSLKA